MKYTIRKTPLARRGRANIQVMATTRDELKHLAQEHGISMGTMVERLIASVTGAAKPRTVDAVLGTEVPQ